MSKRRLPDHSAEHEVKVDLTPMIDLTFLLVMFFILTSQFTTLNLEDVELPVAMEAAEQGKEKVIIINVKKINDATREGQIVFNTRPQTEESLEAALKLEARVDAARRGQESGEGDGGPLSKLEVLVRADEGTHAGYLRQVFKACQGAGIYKVKISAVKP